jgi:hypothetical protein
MEKKSRLSNFFKEEMKKSPSKRNNFYFKLKAENQRAWNYSGDVGVSTAQNTGWMVLNKGARVLVG